MDEGAAIPMPLSAAIANPALKISQRASGAISPTLAYEDRARVFRVASPLRASSQDHAAGWFAAQIDELTAQVRLERHDVPGGLTLVSTVAPEGLGRWNKAVQHAGAAVFTAADGAAALVLTPRRDGLKEDIVLTRALADSLVFEWQLTLDAGLSALLEKDGAVSVYDSTSAVLGNVQVGDAKSAELLERARQRASTNELRYRIPAPVVRAAEGALPSTRAAYALARVSGAAGSSSHWKLTLSVHGLADVRYPITIDPTVLIASGLTQRSNNEGAVDVADARVVRAATPAATSSWTVLDPMTTPRYWHNAVVHDNRIYLIGGNSAQGILDSVHFAAIRDDGTLGPWTATTPLPSARQQTASVVHNGFLYVTGGYELGGEILNQVLVAPIHPDGTLGAWAATTDLPSVRYGHSAHVYNGQLYLLGGMDTGIVQPTDVQTALINPDGTLGAFTQAGALSAGRAGHASAVYDGKLYLVGGSMYCCGELDDVQVAAFNADGTIGAFTATSSFADRRVGHQVAVYNGFLYVFGGQIANGWQEVGDVQVAPIRADGSVGAFTSAGLAFVDWWRKYHASVMYNGRIYILGGYYSTSSLADVQMASLRADGQLVRPTSFTTTSLPEPRYDHATVAYGGYLYVIGGLRNTGGLGNIMADVKFAAFRANGTLGPWTSTSSFRDARYLHESIVHNGFLYVIGGTAADGSLADVQMAPIHADGTLGAFTQTSGFSTARQGHTSFVHNDYLYVLGGRSDNVSLNDVQFAAINPDGTLGPFSTTTSFSIPRWGHSTAVFDGRVYLAGGTGLFAGPFKDVQVGQLNADGTIAAWRSTTPLPRELSSHKSVVHAGRLYVVGADSRVGTRFAPIHADGNLGSWRDAGPVTINRYLHTAVVHNGYLYQIAGLTGDNTTTRADVDVSFINSDGSLGTQAPQFSATSSFVTARRGHCAVAYRGYFYVAGGRSSAGQYLEDVQVAEIREDGSLGSFASTTALSGAREGHVCIAYDGYLYLIGGDNGSKLDDVQMAPIALDGALGAFARAGSLNVARSSHSGAAHNGYLYVAGGSNDSYLDAVETAQILPTGRLSSFVPSGSFATPRDRHSSVVYNDYLYILGGRSNAGALSDVQAALLHGDGTLGPFSPTASLSLARSAHASAAIDGYLYAIGGTDGDVEIAAIAEAGAVEPFATSAVLDAPREGHALAVHGNHMYIAGGDTGTAYLNDVVVSPLVAPAARGLYSKLVDLGRVVSSVDTLTAKGTLGLRGAVRFAYRVAGESGVFGPLVDRGRIALGAPVALGDTDVRYVWARFELDDRATITTNRSAAARDLTELSITYADPCTGVSCSAPDACHLAGTCDPSTGQCSNVAKPDGATCDDGSACTLSDVCIAGVCSGSDPVVCSARDQCHEVGTCDAATGACSNPAKLDGVGCDDGSACTLSDVCLAGICSGSDPVVCFASDQCHDVGTCDAATGACSNPAKLDGVACDDGSACSVSDACVAGVCTSGAPIVCSALDACHVAGACDPATGACSSPAKPNGAVCDDGSACTVSDACIAGICTSGAPIVCSALDACHVAGACEPSTGACSNPMKPDGTGCDDGSACTVSDACLAGVCTSGAPVACSVSDSCHLAGSCDPATGVCSNPAKADGAACNDGNPCTMSEQCFAGTCSGGSPIVCTAIDLCHLAGTCDPTTGQCSTPAKTCVVSDQCHFAGSCEPATGVCSNPAKPDGAVCDDGSACTQRDACAAGTCVGGDPVVCTASDKCHLAGECDPQSGACTDPAKVCVASDQCHVAGVCNVSTGACSNPNKASGSACDDSNACTLSDACDAGSCVGEPVVCVTENACQLAGTCDPASGVCSYQPKADGASCDDGNACTRSDVCAAGSCTGGNAVVCAASDQCHVAGVCDATTGACSNPAKSDGSACDDGNACTRADECAVGSCTGGNAVVCAASDQCHVAGVCDATTGACSNPTKADGSACDDGNACTRSDACVAGSCTGSNAVVCAASDQCHAAGVCDATTGACSNPAKADGSACDDGSVCTRSDACVAGRCTGSNAVVCAASDQCHVAGACDASTGACSNPAKADGSTCDDGNACTRSDACAAGSCTGASAVVCAASDQCHVAGVCDATTGSCSNPAKADGSTCDDGNACTQSDACAAGSCTGSNAVVCAASDQCHGAGACNPSTGVCTNPIKPNGTACDDGNACTRSDACFAGSCSSGIAVACAASDLCHLAGECDRSTGTCSNPAKVCVASDQCHLAGRCSLRTGMCSNPVRINGAICDDGDACTRSDACVSGTCTGSPISCSASDECHLAGTCDPETGTCANPMRPDGASCNDSNACTQSDVCMSGSCTGTEPVVCAADDQCHLAGVCDPVSGTCQHPARPDGANCDDGDACTQSDICASGSCTGTPVVCTALDQCHLAGTCNPSTGQCSSSLAKPNGAACDDHNACTQSDTCAAGSCIGNKPIVCVASDRCHAAGSCDPTSGLCDNPARICDARDQCHLSGTCDLATGECSNPQRDQGAPCDGGICGEGVCVRGPDAISDAGRPDASISEQPDAASKPPGKDGSANDAAMPHADAAVVPDAATTDAAAPRTPVDASSEPPATDSGPGAQPTKPASEPACGCRLVGARSSHDRVALALLGLALLTLIRRRQRSSTHKR